MNDTPHERALAKLDMPTDFQDVVKLTKLGGMLSRPFFATFAKEHKLTLNEWRVLVMLSRAPGIASQEISAFTGLHAMNVSRAVRGLREAGRLESHVDPDNHRRQLLELTDEGRALFDLLYPSARGRATELFSIFTDAELEQFRSMLDRLIAQAENVFDATEE